MVAERIWFHIKSFNTELEYIKNFISHDRELRLICVYDKCDC